MRTREEVNTRLRKFNVSNQALNITSLILCAIETDPHPTWRGEITKDEFISNLPEYFEIISKEYPNAKITTFDFLHWLSRYLDRICPIEKTGMIDKSLKTNE